MPYLFERTSTLPVPVETAFAWHTRPGAIQRMMPPWDQVELLYSDGNVRDGSRVKLRVPLLGPIRKTWIAEHFGYQENVQFGDRQISGPFGSFVHHHRFQAEGPDQSRLTDHIEYTPPLGLFGLPGLPIIRGKLESAFAYRHRVLRSDLTRHARYADQPRRKVAVTGSTGLVGRALVPFLTTGGHDVVRLVRSRRPATIPDGTTSVYWNPATGEIDRDGLQGVDTVIHLAGEGIAEGRWSVARKERILQSRVQGTKLLAETLTQLPKPPQVFFSASAIGYYPPSGDTPLTEEHPPGQGFLSEVCRQWESATVPARKAGIRTVLGRIGVVLTPAGGALAAQLPLFRLGIAGRLSQGTQYVPWITLDDLVGAIHHCVMEPTMEGPVNLTAPEPVTNQEFTKTLGRVLWRPTLLPAPAFGLRLALGEMADALLLASLRVVPKRLEASQFPFDYPRLEPGLRHVLGC